MADRLGDLYHAWESWAGEADRSENGWESDFPSWSDLMDTAQQAMLDQHPTAHMLELIEQCWKISEESEELATFARTYIDATWNTVQHLARAASPAVRWQVYSIADAAGTRAEALLRRGLEDADAYARRRALLSLAHLGPRDRHELALRFVEDRDPYIRRSVLALLDEHQDATFVRTIRQRLASDPEEIVRTAAQQQNT